MSSQTIKKRFLFYRFIGNFSNKSMLDGTLLLPGLKYLPFHLTIPFPLIFFSIQIVKTRSYSNLKSFKKNKSFFPLWKSFWCFAVVIYFPLRSLLTIIILSGFINDTLSGAKIFSGILQSSETRWLEMRKSQSPFIDSFNFDFDLHFISDFLICQERRRD